MSQRSSGHAVPGEMHRRRCICAGATDRPARGWRWPVRTGLALIPVGVAGGEPVSNLIPGAAVAGRLLVGPDMSLIWVWTEIGVLALGMAAYALWQRGRRARPDMAALHGIALFAFLRRGARSRIGRAGAPLPAPTADDEAPCADPASYPGVE